MWKTKSSYLIDMLLQCKNRSYERESNETETAKPRTVGSVLPFLLSLILFYSVLLSYNSFNTLALSAHERNIGRLIQETGGTNHCISSLELGEGTKAARTSVLLFF